jgi:hypothetical protein
MKIKYRTIEIQEVLDHFMVKLSSDFSDDVRVLSLNETSCLILTSIQDGLNEGEIVKKMLDTYNVDEATAQKEVKAFIQQLKDSGIVE